MHAESEDFDHGLALQSQLAKLSTQSKSVLTQVIERPDKTARLAELTRDIRVKAELTSLAKAVPWFEFAWHGEVWVQIDRDIAPLLKTQLSDSELLFGATPVNDLVQLLEGKAFASPPRDFEQLLKAVAEEGGLLPLAGLSKDDRQLLAALLKDSWTQGRLALVGREEKLVVLAPTLVQRFVSTPSIAEWEIASPSVILTIFSALGALARNDLRSFRKQLFSIQERGHFPISNLRNKIFRALKSGDWIKNENKQLRIGQLFQAENFGAKLTKLFVSIVIQSETIIADSRLVDLLPVAIEHMLSGNLQSLTAASNETLIMAIVSGQLPFEAQNFFEHQTQFWPALIPIAEQLGLVDVGLDADGKNVLFRPSYWAESLFKPQFQAIKSLKALNYSGQSLCVELTTTDLSWLSRAAFYGELQFLDSPTAFEWIVDALALTTHSSAIESLCLELGASLEQLDFLQGQQQIASVTQAWILEVESQRIIEQLLNHSVWCELVEAQIDSRRVVLKQKPKLNSPFVLWLNDLGVRLRLK